MQIEQEIKFRVSPQAARRVWRLVPLASVPLRQEFVGIYYDTRSERLRRAGVGLRLRREGRRWMQTLKVESAAHAGLAARAEWESEAHGRLLDVGAFPREAIMAATGLDLQRVAPKLRPLFETRFVRRRAMIELPGGSRAELCVDRGYIAAALRREVLLEMELELKAGDARSMIRLAEKLARPLALEIEFQSKSQRGYRLASGHPAEAPYKWSRPAIAESATPGESFALLFGAALRQIGINARGVLTSRDLEFLHQMRVGLRRLQSALRAYRGLVKRSDAKPLARELHRIVPPLGAARDWDVFCDWLASEAKTAGREAVAVRALLVRARRRRAAARRGARDTIASWRFQRFLLRALRWLLEAPWSRKAAARNAPLYEFGGRSLERLHHKAVKDAYGLDWRDATQRHALRIKVKRLRYASGFFAGSFPRASVRSYLKHLQALQDILGELNDVAVARRLVRELAQPGAGANYVRRALAARERALIASLEPAWTAFGKRAPFWHRAPQEAVRAPA